VAVLVVGAIPQPILLVLAPQAAQAAVAPAVLAVLEHWVADIYTQVQFNKVFQVALVLVQVHLAILMAVVEVVEQQPLAQQPVLVLAATVALDTLGQ
jgi:hypothetical protein